MNERDTRPDFWKLRTLDGPGLVGDHGTFYSAYGDPVTRCGHHAGSRGVSGGDGWLSQELGDSPGVGGSWRGLFGGTGNVPAALRYESPPGSAGVRLAHRDVAQLGRALDWGSRGRGFKSRRPDCFSNASSPYTAAVQQYPRKTLKVCMRPLSGRHAVGGCKITTLGRGGLASQVLRVVRHQRRTPLTASLGCWHTYPVGVSAMLTLAPGSSPWPLQPAHGGTPAYVTDGDGRAGIRCARSAVLY